VLASGQQKGETQRGSDSSRRGEILKMYLLKNNFKNIPVPIFFKKIYTPGPLGPTAFFTGAQGGSHSYLFIFSVFKI
jgi:hypothetical protein